MIAPNPAPAPTRPEGNPIPLSPGPTLLQVAPAPADEPMARSRALRRATTESRFLALPPEIQGLAFSFRPLISPQIRYYPRLAAATLLVCTLLQLIVGVPYAANERADVVPALRTALRGLIVGIWMYATSLIEFMATHVCMPHAACSCCMVGTS